MKIGIVSLFNDAYAKIGNLTLPNKQAYARRHGYWLHNYRANLCEDRHVAWSKLKAHQDVLPRYDATLWIDADAVFADINRPMEPYLEGEPDIDLFIGAEYAGLNAGAYLLRNSPAAFEYLQATWDAPEKYPQECGPFLWNLAWEQAAMNVVMRENQHAIRYKVVGEDFCANYWHSGNNFIVHPFASDRGRRYEYLDELLNPYNSYCESKDDLFLAAAFGKRKGTMLHFCGADLGQESVARKFVRMGWRVKLIGPPELLQERWRGFNSVTCEAFPTSERYEIVSVEFEALADALLERLRLACRDAMLVVCPLNMKNEVKLLGFPVEIHRTTKMIILGRRPW